MLSHIDVGEGTPILLIHGLGSRKEAWTPQLALAERYRLIIPDLRGHGETSLDIGICMYNFAADILELLEEKGIESTYVCGLSLGGLVAQELYKQNPHIVKGLILANTTSYISSFLASGVVHDAIRSYRKDNFIDTILSRDLYNQSYREEARKIFLIRDSYIESVKAPLDINYFPTLMSIKKPVLLIGSSCDKVVPIMNMWTMKMFLCHAKVKVFLATGHLSNIERAVEFNKEVDKFIGGM
jgi:3-oxoadipate enol-lactonase